MKKIILSFLALLLFLNITAQVTTTKSILKSQQVGDEFDIYITKPTSYDSTKKYNVVYYCDANLKSGNAIREFLETSKDQDKINKLIFVGVGHIGNFHVLRRRDLIQPLIIKNDTVAKNAKYGNSDKFKKFLETELIPKIDQEYSTSKDSNALIGHSLGGLFAFYCLFKGDSKFAKIFALSPALWINKFSIYDFDKTPNNSSNISLFFASGSKETMNHILSGTNEMKDYLDKKQYRNLFYEYKIFEGETHNSEVILSFDKIFEEYL